MRLNMSSWRQGTIGVPRKLQLDPRNVRLGLPEDSTEREVLYALFKDEDAYALAKSIARSGWLTHELPVVLEREDDTVVVEGNRRIAALKGLLSPGLVPEYRTRLTRLAQTADLDSIRRIRVTFAPDEHSASLLIAALHTSNLRRPWGRSRQAVYFERLIREGSTVEELVNDFPGVEVRDLLYRGAIRRIFLTGLADSRELSDYFSGPRAPMTVLERLTDNAEFMELAGISIDQQDFSVSTSLDASSFQALATRIVSDMKKEDITTRSLNKPGDLSYQRYMKKLEKLVSGSTATGSDESKLRSDIAPRPPAGSSSEGAASGSVKDSDAEPASKEPPRPSPTKLPTAGVEVWEKMPSPIHVLTQEIREINYKKFPNATGDLLRSYLEKCIVAYAAKVGQTIDVKGTKPVQLSDALLWLEKWVSDPTNNLKAYRHSVQLLRSDRALDRSGSLGLMNSVNHNPELAIRPREVLELWNSMDGIVRFLVNPAPGLRAK